MKRISIFLAFLWAAFVNAQNQLPQQGLQMTEHNHEKCYAGILHHQMMENNPDYVLKMNQFEQYVQSMSDSFTPKTQATYVIPVVFHVIHLGEAVGTGTNVSDDAIKRAIRVANERYRNLNNGGGADTQIEFALAVQDPSGNCTNGITRTNYSSNSAYANYGVKVSGNNGISDSQLKGIISWNRNKYYNIYIVSEIDNNNGGAGTQGYAYMASNHGNATDGAVFMASNILQDFDHTLIHELGHALNLYHTFEGDGTGNTCPPSSPTQGDMCADTPPHKRSQSDCNVTGTNSCDGGSSNALFVHNYMDYSSVSCVTQFTANQGTRMRAACSGPRASFFTSNNALVPVSAPTAAIIIPQKIYCSGTVNLYDNSSCVANTYTEHSEFSGNTHSWSVTNGSVTLTSSKQNPTFNITSTGWYSVTLTVTTAQGTNTITETDAFYYAGTSVSTCTPNLGTPGPNGINASEVTFNTISSFTSSSETNTYENLVCTKNTIVNAGDTYPISVKINTYGYTSYVKVYIDWENNGTYSAAEKVLEGSVASSGSNQTSGYVTGNVVIPATAVQNQILRMRVIMDAATAPTEAKANCSGSLVAGDVEDYGVLVKDNCPLANVSTQPVNTTICPNGTGTISSSISGGTSYQWQVSTDNGSTWSDVTNNANYAGATTQSLSLTNVPTSFNTQKYRLKITNSCGDKYTNVATLTVSSTITFSTQPANETVCANGTISLTAVASGGTYQWQASTDGGITWSNISDGGNYSGAGTGTLTIATIPGSFDANQYRCVATSSCTTQNSSVATLTVTASSAQITSQPQDLSACPNSGATFGVTGTGITGYQWQVSTDNGATWNNVDDVAPVSGSTTATLNIASVTTIMNNTKYRCVLTTSCGNINSSVATLSVTAAGVVNITAQPQNTGMCPNGSTFVQVTASGATAYQWEISTDGGTTWANVTNNTNYTGATTNQLTISGLGTSGSGVLYRCQVTGPCGNTATNSAVLTISDIALITSQPSSEVVCESVTHTFSVQADLAVSYSWQISFDGNTWYDLNNSTTYSGVNTAALTVSNVQMNLNNTKYRCSITGACGGSAYTNSVVLTVNKRPEIYFGAPQVACIYDSPYSISEVTPSGGTFSGPGISNNLFNPVAAGMGTHTITYTVTENGCSSSASSTIEVSQCLGMTDLVKNELSIFPNPTSSIVYLKGTVENYETAVLIDNQGRMISSWDLKTTAQFDLSDFVDGYYFIRVVGKENTVVTKIQLVK